LDTILQAKPVSETSGIKQADAKCQGEYRILVTDLVVPWRIGVRRHEEDRRQRVRINLDLAVRDMPDAERDDYRDVLCYEDIVERIREMAATGHVKLVETLAQRVATLCLSDPRTERVTVRVEKLDAVPDAGSVGVELTQQRNA
jgi:dihydroneopterin aldolase